MKAILNENPVFELYQQHSKNVEQSKTKLFSRLNSINPSIKKQIEQLYNARKTEQPSPYLGELYPWVIQELFDLKNDAKIQETSQDWLALYYYTIFTDDVIDASKQIDGKTLISLTALMKEGLLKLHKTVANTAFENQFDAVLNDVLNNGKQEEKFSQSIGHRTLKVQYTKKKNDLLKLCAMALLANCKTDKETNKKVLAFSDKLQLCFQYLDDIADIKQDFNDKNYTVVLNDLFENLDIKTVNEDNLLSKLVETGILLSFVSEVKTLLSEIIDFIPVKNETVSEQYFYSLLIHISQLEEELSIGFDDSNPLDLEIIRRRIQIVAQST